MRKIWEEMCCAGKVRCAWGRGVFAGMRERELRPHSLTRSPGDLGRSKGGGGRRMPFPASSTNWRFTCQTVSQLSHPLARNRCSPRLELVANRDQEGIFHTGWKWYIFRVCFSFSLVGALLVRVGR